MISNTKLIEKMWACYKLGLLETGYIKYGEIFLKVRGPDILSAIKNVLPTLIANDIIGVQPMTGPIGQIHTLRTRYKC